MVGEAHIHRGAQWSQGVETVMIAWPDQAFHGGCEPSSLGCSHDSSTAEYLGESHITSSVNGTCGLDDLPEHFPLHQAGDGRTYVDVPTFTVTWEVTAQLLCHFPWLLHVGSHVVPHVPSVPARIATVLSTHYTVGDNTICVTSSWAPQGQC